MLQGSPWRSAPPGTSGRPHASWQNFFTCAQHAFSMEAPVWGAGVAVPLALHRILTNITFHDCWPCSGPQVSLLVCRWVDRVFGVEDQALVAKMCLWGSILAAPVLDMLHLLLWMSFVSTGPLSVCVCCSMQCTVLQRVPLWQPLYMLRCGCWSVLVSKIVVLVALLGTWVVRFRESFLPVHGSSLDSPVRKHS